MSAARVVLCLNSGSSSLKFALYAVGDGREDALLEGEVEQIGREGGALWLREAGERERRAQPGAFRDYAAAVRAALDAVERSSHPRAVAVGHRLVHGGPDYVAPTRITPAVLDALRRAVPFAPLHLPAEIAEIEAVAAARPELVQVACFDTAFHRALPEVARRFPLPRAFAERGVRRYGFHGLSYEYVVAHLGDAARGRLVIAHLGSGASLAAVRDGASVDTTMGFTPDGGVMMATRTGDLDPGLMLYLLEHEGRDARALERLVTREAGLLGVSGSTADMRTLLARRATDPDAALAVEMFCYQVRKAVGALAAALGGMDALVFTGGIGERAEAVRAEVCAGLGYLGVVLDPARNEQGAGVISAQEGRCTVRVVETDEARMIARHTARVVGQGA